MRAWIVILRIYVQPYCFLGFHGLFRISELLDLQAADVIVHNQYLEILVKSSKIDQHSEGNKVFFSKIGGITCFHVLVCRSFASAGIDTNSSVRVFRAAGKVLQEA